MIPKLTRRAIRSLDMQYLPTSPYIFTRDAASPVPRTGGSSYEAIHVLELDHGLLFYSLG